MLSITTMVRYMYIQYNKADSWWYQEDAGPEKQTVLSITTMVRYMYNINKADSWWYQEDVGSKNKLCYPLLQW